VSSAAGDDRRPNIDLQVLPASQGAHATGSGDHFVLLGRDDERDPMVPTVVVYLELHRRGLYLDAPGDVRDCKIMAEGPPQGGPAPGLRRSRVMFGT
jgi:hypothetical protein